MVRVAGGSGLFPSRWCSICAPLICGSTTTYHRRKFPLDSFSCGGGLRGTELLLDDYAKVEDVEVESALMVDDRAAEEDMISAAGR